MDKKGFIKTFSEEDPYRMAKLFESLERAKSFNFFYHTDEFYTPGVWNRILNMKEYRDIHVMGEDFFERRIFASGVRGGNPLAIMEIENLDHQMELAHRDYLGAIMSLGILREKFGDIFLKDDKAYLVIFKEMADFILNNLNQIGRCSVKLTLHEYEEKVLFLKPNLVKREAVIASLRLDVVVAELARTSRTKSLEMIQKGLVLLNYNEARDKAKEINEGDTLTIRRKGKFKIGEIIGTTQKGNLRVAFYKFE
ncbi:YlmH/Sll1252 family protein [Proteiniclasticum sp. C24MP]|uniref:YlmH/Sll1252 family protein n=1 Tax=Proteiniclasticum sp. C24MP TaxID=3374101 RepID=UPI003754E93C